MRFGAQAFYGDRITALFADAVGSVVELREGMDHFGELMLLLFQQ